MDIYNAAADTVGKWKTEWEDIENADYIEEMIQEAESSIRNLQNAISMLENYYRTISGWRTDNLNAAIRSYRVRYKNACSNLKLQCENLEEDITKAYSTLVELQESLASSSSDEIDQIISELFLLDIDETITVEGLVGEINDLTMAALDTLESDSIQKVVLLKDMLGLYDEYLTLRDNLQDFLQDHLNSIIQVDAENEDAVNDWTATRSVDFNLFCSYIYDLPDISEISELLKLDSQSSEDGYTTGDVLEEALDIQRDLLGTLTKFEKAFIFLKYKFPIMAYFSISIAVFFDLGAFLTGCFLFMTEYFEVDGNGQDEKQ